MVRRSQVGTITDRHSKGAGGDGSGGIFTKVAVYNFWAPSPKRSAARLPVPLQQVKTPGSRASRPLCPASISADRLGRRRAGRRRREELQRRTPPLSLRLRGGQHGCGCASEFGWRWGPGPCIWPSRRCRGPCWTGAVRQESISMCCCWRSRWAREGQHRRAGCARKRRRERAWGGWGGRSRLYRYNRFHTCARMVVSFLLISQSNMLSLIYVITHQLQQSSSKHSVTVLAEHFFGGTTGPTVSDKS